MGSGATVTAAQTANPLDCFFPFDPYTLKRYVLGREHSHAIIMWMLYPITIKGVSIMVKFLIFF